LNVLGIAGWSGSGKTTLIEGLIPALAALGLRVSTVKRTHHDVDLDQPGKDSFRHRKAGAAEVLVVSDRRFALLRETPEGLDLPALLGRLAPVDLVLVEGFKMDALPKLEVFRASLGKPRLWPGTPGIIAVAADGPVAGALPRLDLNDAAAVASWLVAEGGACNKMGSGDLSPACPGQSPGLSSY
jgi:molybdopterin-guanine dinucleotide biosynthesis protein B